MISAFILFLIVSCTEDIEWFEEKQNDTASSLEKRKSSPEKNKTTYIIKMRKESGVYMIPVDIDDEFLLLS